MLTKDLPEVLHKRSASGKLCLYPKPYQSLLSVKIRMKLVRNKG